MEKINQQMELLRSKKRINKSDSVEAAQLIVELYQVNNDSEMVGDYFHFFPRIVAEAFMSHYYFDLDGDAKNKVIDNFINNLKFKENRGGSSLVKSFSLLTALVSRDPNDKNSVKLVKAIVDLAWKNNKFSPTACKNLGAFLNSHEDTFLDLDFTGLEGEEKRNIFRYLYALIPDIKSGSYGNRINEWAKRNAVTAPEAKEVIGESINGNLEQDSSQNREEIKEVNVDTLTPLALDGTEKLISRLKAANEEAEKLFNGIFNKNQSIVNLQDQIDQRDKTIDRLKAELDNKDVVISDQENKLSEAKQKLLEATAEIGQLNQSLKKIYNLDQIEKEQKLKTLRNDIKMAVKLQYEDFMEHRESICSEDNYDGLKSNLNQVFRTLKRYGVDL